MIISPIYIYAIYDDAGSPKYVGATYEFAKRCTAHWCLRHSVEKPVYQWMRTLEKRPDFRVIDVCEDFTKVSPRELERAWLERFILDGHTLLNIYPKPSWNLCGVWNKRTQKERDGVYAS